MVDRRSRPLSKPRTLAVAVLILAAVLAAGCGTDDATSSTAAADGADGAPDRSETDELTAEETNEEQSGVDGTVEDPGDGSGGGGSADAPATDPGSSPPSSSPSPPSTADSPADSAADEDDPVAQAAEELRNRPTPTVPGFRIDLVIRPAAGATGAAVAGVPTEVIAALAWVEGVHAVETVGAASSDGTYPETTVQLGAGADPDRVAARIEEVVGDDYAVTAVKRPASTPMPDNTIGPGHGGTDE